MSEVGFAISERDGLKRVEVYKEAFKHLKNKKQWAKTNDFVILKSLVRTRRVARRLPYFFQKYGH